MKKNWLRKAKGVWTILRPLVESARKGKKPWLSLTIWTNAGAGLLIVFNFNAVADLIIYDPDIAKIIGGVWAAFQVYLRCHSKGQIKLQD